MVAIIKCNCPESKVKKEFIQVGEDKGLQQMVQRRLHWEHGELEKGPWLFHRDGWEPGVYCAYCLKDLEYAEDDLSEAGIDDTPLLFMPPEEFSADKAVKSLKRKWSKRIAYVQDLEPQPERLADPKVEKQLDSGLRQALHQYILPEGKQLYSHQGEAIQAILNGKNVVVVTATASGKTLCYQLPILDAILRDSQATALYLSPLKALEVDQFESLLRYDPRQLDHRVSSGDLEAYYRKISVEGHKVSMAIYDGSTPDEHRGEIRKSEPNILFTNPEMLHMAVLGHADLWEYLFPKLRYVVIDELHTYRGIFGSNFANVLRRLRRLCAYYGAHPQFVCCSATVRNPDGLARNLIGNLKNDSFMVVEQDGSPKYHRKFVLMRGTEDTLNTDTRKLLVELVGSQRVSLIGFGRTIPAVGRIYHDTRHALEKDLGIEADILTLFRAALPPAKKREIAKRLRSGSLHGVISTTALQLGIDIGKFSASVLAGYPYSIAATWQQAGRAGRRGEGLYVLLADKDPVDQFWVEHPEIFFSEEPEEVIVDPDNRYVLLNQLWCALRDLEIDEKRDAEFFGRDFHGCLEELRDEDKADLIRKEGRDVWVLRDKDGFPAKEVPLRNPLGRDRIEVVTECSSEPVAYEDAYAATKRLHRYAIYQVIDEYYLVDKLVLDGPTRYAKVHRIPDEKVEYFTIAKSEDKSEIIDAKLSRKTFSLPVHHGDVTFTSKVVGYVKIYYEPKKGKEKEYQTLGKASPPGHSFDTKATWVEFPASLIAGYDADRLFDALNSIGMALVSASGILRFADPRDLGVVVDAAEATVFIHEQYPGGIGLAERCYDRFEELLQRAYEILADCPYCTQHPDSKGCPRCAMDIGDRHNRQAALKILETCRAAKLGKSKAKTTSETVEALEGLGYRDLELAGGGGMGQVYRAQNDQGATVALKVIEPRFWHDTPKAREMLLAEGKVWKDLAHPNILRLASIQEHQGVLLLEMEFAHHGDLRARIGKGMAVSQALPIFRGICDGVTYLHERKLVHRDLKPDNILFVQPDVPKIADFGIVKALRGSASVTRGMGTPGYWAPEQQCEKGKVSPATDVYALGVILFEMLTGELPIWDVHGLFVVDAVTRERISDSIFGIIQKCLGSKPEMRFTDAGDLRTSLEEKANGRVTKSGRTRK